MQTTQKTVDIPIEYKRLFDTDWREAAIYGGRYSLKSHTVARVLLILGRQKKMRFLCCREFQNSIAESSHQLLKDIISMYDLNEYKATENAIVNQITGTEFVFKGLHHNEQSIKSIEGVDLAWVEEAQSASKESIEVLTPTVRKPGSKLIYTYNRLLEEDPIHKRLVLEGRPNTLIIHVNYDIAEKYGYLPDEIRNEIEDDRLNRPALYKHKWLGEPNSLERRVYKDWKQIDDVPHEARLERRGLDFGYKNDPSAIVAIYSYNGGYILDQELYRKGMHNNEIAAVLNNAGEPNTLVIGDSAEPKSIDELRLSNVNITGVKKVGGQDSGGTKKTFKQYGIDFVGEKRISVTKRSSDIWREYMSYLHKEDKDGRILNDPEDGNDHCFAPDTMIYTTKGKSTIESLVGTSGYLYSRDGTTQKYSNVRATRKDAEVVTIAFDDGQALTVTPDHLLLQPDGTWIEASLLCPLDMIQSYTYGLSNTNLQRQSLQAISWGEILQTVKTLYAQTGMGIPQWSYPEGLSYSPQRPRQSKQLHRQFRDKGQALTPKRPHDSRKTRATKNTCRQDKTTNKEVAQVRRGQGVAQATWSEGICKPQTNIQKLCALSYRIFNEAFSKECKILRAELLHESPTKTVKRITRGFQAVTYNLEVENTHCLIANGVVAHNCMDATLYGFMGLRPTKRDSANQTSGNITKLWY